MVKFLFRKAIAQIAQTEKRLFLNLVHSLKKPALPWPPMTGGPVILQA